MCTCESCTMSACLSCLRHDRWHDITCVCVYLRVYLCIIFACIYMIHVCLSTYHVCVYLYDSFLRVCILDDCSPNYCLLKYIFTCIHMYMFRYISNRHFLIGVLKFLCVDDHNCSLVLICLSYYVYVCTWIYTHI